MARRRRKNVHRYVTTNFGDGINRLMQDFSRYSEESQQSITEAVKDVTEKVAESAKGRVHDVTGTLRKSISTNYNYVTNVGTVSAKAPHAHLVEFGAGPAHEMPKRTVKQRKNGPKALTVPNGYAAYAQIPSRHAKPFMKPAAEKEAPALEARIKEILR